MYFSSDDIDDRLIRYRRVKAPGPVLDSCGGRGRVSGAHTFYITRQMNESLYSVFLERIGSLTGRCMDDGTVVAFLLLQLEGLFWFSFHRMDSATATVEN